MTAWLRRTWLVCGGLVAVACASAPPPSPRAVAEEARSIFIVRRNLHTGIAFRAADLGGTRLLPFAAGGGARAVEFGWGESEYYQASRKSSWRALATVLPSDSVMSVLSLAEVSRAQTRDYEVVELPVTPQELRAIAESIERAFAGDAPVPTGRTRRIDAGELSFFRANETFHLFRMCTRWTTDRLRMAGCRVGALPVLTPRRAMREASRCAAQRGVSAAR